MAETVEAGGHIIDAVTFRNALMTWGREHFRPFPWRLTVDPYRILVAEVMLHRTQARQVVAVYERFIKRYPDACELGAASKDELHDALHPLGLRWRIDLVRGMATELVEQFGGQIPRERSDLLSLPGVSDYIAGAVRCFAWNLPEPLVDTNSVRVVGRLFGLRRKDSSRRNRGFRDLIAALVDPEQPGAYNHALLDLADRLCVQRHAPECEHCPVREWCDHARSCVVQGGMR